MPAALLKQPAAHRPTVSPRARPVTQGAVENGCVLVFFGFRPGFPSCQSKPSGATVTVPLRKCVPRPLTQAASNIANQSAQLLRNLYVPKIRLNEAAVAALKLLGTETPTACLWLIGSFGCMNRCRQISGTGGLVTKTISNQRPRGGMATFRKPVALTCRLRLEGCCRAVNAEVVAGDLLTACNLLKSHREKNLLSPYCNIRAVTSKLCACPRLAIVADHSS
jgi:hypothetical protein